MALKLHTKKLRDEKGMTQMDLAIELNLGNTSIQQYEAGLHEPSFENLIKIADYFGVTVDFLIGRTPIRGKLNTDDEKLAYQLRNLKNERAKRAAIELLEEVQVSSSKTEN